jgi:hypothetical protein
VCSSDLRFSDILKLDKYYQAEEFLQSVFWAAFEYLAERVRTIDLSQAIGPKQTLTSLLDDVRHGDELRLWQQGILLRVKPAEVTRADHGGANGQHEAG